MTNRPSLHANKLTWTVCVFYLIALFWILIFKLGVRFSYMENRSVNLIPFREAFALNGRLDRVQALANVLIFVPLGVYVAMLGKRLYVWKQLLLLFAVSFLIEALQFICRIGAFDSTDLVTNTCGGLLGLWLVHLIRRAFKSDLAAQRFINIAALIGTILLFSFLILLKLNKLPIRYQ
jgi:glycopeptide antibiotics resistance protein